MGQPVRLLQQPGHDRFVGREDFVNPVFMDPTWGVSDQDMFDRSVQELDKLAKAPDGKPFYALLQTCPTTPPMRCQGPAGHPGHGHGSLDEHLTAMRYADWSLGQFFAKVKNEPWYQDTLFVIVGDHGFGNNEQITEMDLSRFNVPLLLIGPGVQETFGARRDTVGSQIDVVPTVLARFGKPTSTSAGPVICWVCPGRFRGVAVIKPSGSDQTWPWSRAIASWSSRATATPCSIAITWAPRPVARCSRATPARRAAEAPGGLHPDRDRQPAG